ncbi:D-alanyl-D-alanine carboxypeptidase family protein [uncultured Acetatifactor sp.]|uniref:D-alanyl-D-alanine carboxypeptidase family protein n=1 Tax=uncultured Acetatifactor sp. TaxID=1671927 RepID=UPI002616F27A|nr:hypothetical protein [uncultured Acetatifactor sp.]
METEEERQARRRARLEEMKREKRRRELLYKWGIPVMAGMAIVVGIGIGFGAAAWTHKDNGRGGALQESQEAHRTGEDSEDKADRGGNGTGEDSEDKADRGGEDSQDGLTADGTKEDSKDKANQRGDGTGGDRENDEDSLTADNQKTQGADSAQRRKSRHAAGGTVMAAGEAYAPRLRFPSQEPGQTEAAQQTAEPEPVPTPEPLGGAIPPQNAVFGMTEATAGFSETILSEYGVFIDAQSGEILAQKEAYTRMNPASMTKMLTILVAAEHLTAEDLEKTAVITIDITDYSYVNDCSNTGYALDEEVTVRDLFYGTILPSGADSALALAIYVAGSHEAFVDLMNERLVQMGLGETSHFTNCVGVYDEAHYSTAYDMAVILKATVDNPFCREVMAAHTYTTSLTEEHPEGLLISNWFLRRIEDKDTHGEVLCAKTGYVDQAGSCAASLGRDEEGKEYLCVTAGSNSTWTCIYDQVELYQTFLPAPESAPEDASDAPG